MTRTGWLLSLLLAVAVLVGCGGDTSADRSTSEDPPPVAASPADEADARTEPQPAPRTPGAAALPAELDFTLPAVGGGQVVGAELAGRDVALWFWAPW